jgi:hypothetical protein
MLWRCGLDGILPFGLCKRDMVRTSAPKFAVLCAEGPPEERVDQEVAGQDADGDEYVERHDEGDFRAARMGK